MSQLGSRWLFKDYGPRIEHLPSMFDTLGCSSSTRKSGWGGVQSRSYGLPSPSISLEWGA